MKLLHRRLFLHLTAGAAVLPAASRIARAQTYPSRPVTMIVPAAAGGATDVSARIVSEHMSRTLGQQIVIENIAGAGGTIGTARTMRAIRMVTPSKWGIWERTPLQSRSTRSSPTNLKPILNRSAWSAPLRW